MNRIIHGMFGIALTFIIFLVDKNGEINTPLSTVSNNSVKSTSDSMAESARADWRTFGA
jgi:hypothetical protein